jgi:membrane protein required for colicin V production
MGFLDIILGGLLAFALFKGFKNGLFVELASLVSLIVGIYVALKFSSAIQEIMSGFVSWNPRTIQVSAFIFLFITIVAAIYFLGKILTGIANFAHIGLVNNLGGGFFRVLKTVMIISIFLSVFEKINFNNTFAEKETLDNSLFYNPIQKTAGFLFPTIENWYTNFKEKNTTKTNPK